MPSKLMKSVSGIRGIVGETMTPELLVKIASAFAVYLKGGDIVLGRDSRITGEAISRAVSSVLILSGCNVIEVGIVPTPTVQIMVEELGAAGGIIISASHNPIEWNAFKLVNNKGVFLNSVEINKFFKIMELDFNYKRWNKIGELKFFTEADEIHINKVLNVIDVNKIRKKRFKVVLDSVNGAGSIITQKLLNKLNCNLHPLYCFITGTFPRGAEPLAHNLKDLSNKVLKEAADIGFAQDPDADRLAIVDEKGIPIGEENTLALVVEHLLSKQAGRVVINQSTTKTIEDIAENYNSKVKRTKVGEINVVDEIIKNGARIGGEGNGGVISPDVHLGRDSLVGIGYILEMMAQRGKSISQLVSELPFYYMKKGKVKYDNKKMDPSIFLKIKKMFNKEKLSTLDGLRIDFISGNEFSGGWVHLRASNTEPVFRIIAEGKSKKQTEKIYRHFAGIFK